jgi:hypothetical protein
MPSLWDKYILRAEALIKLALMGSPLGTPILHRLGKDLPSNTPHLIIFFETLSDISVRKI